MTRPPLRHGDTEARATGFDAVLESVFDKLRENARTVAIALGLVLALSVIAALAYDSRRKAEDEAATMLVRIENQFAAAMGAPPGSALAPEPANPDLARRAREAALEQLQGLIEEHAGHDAARVASVRAAEMEVDLGRLDAASERLASLEADLDGDDPLLGVALRLHGYTLDQLGRGIEAAETLQRGAEVPTYAARALLFIEAGEAFERAGEPRRAITVYQQALSLAPDLGERARLPRRIATLDYKAAVAVPDVSSDKEHSVK